MRDVKKAGDLEALGVRVRSGDFAVPESLRHSFEGARQVLLVSSNAASYGGDPLAQHRAAIDAARAVGAKRIVYTSHLAASATSAFPPMLDHAATEQMLRDCGLAWTALRNGFYADSAFTLMGAALETGLIEAPADGKVSWAAHDDLAEAAAVILKDEGRFDGATPPLTGSQALDLADLAAIASELLGRPVRREVIADEALLARLGPRGRFALGLYLASRRGEFSVVDPTLEQLLGRRTLQVRELLQQKLAEPRR